MTDFDPAEDLADLNLLQGEMDELFALDPVRLVRVVPEVSGWSSEQHLAHVALANELVLRNLKSLATGQGHLLVREAESNPRALAALASGKLPRGQAQSPRMVRPPERVDRALLREWLADGRAALREIDPYSLPADEPKIPHQLLGPLDAPQWARFAAVHTRHHLEIVREILAGVARANR